MSSGARLGRRWASGLQWMASGLVAGAWLTALFWQAAGEGGAGDLLRSHGAGGLYDYQLLTKSVARPQRFRIRQFNPRRGEFSDLGESLVRARHNYQPAEGGQQRR